MANLRWMDLFGNNFSGELPPEWGNLVNLQRLDLGGSQLSGCLPYELAASLDEALTGLALSVCVPQAPPAPKPPSDEGT